MRAFFLIAILFWAAFGTFALKKCFAQDAERRFERGASFFLPPSDADSDVKIADIPEPEPSGAAANGENRASSDATTFLVPETNSASGVFAPPKSALLSSEPIALSPLSTSGGVADGIVETSKLDPYTSRSPSSWATTSIRASRNSVFQSVGAELFIEPGARLDKGGVFETQVDATFGLPFFSMNAPLLISPTFSWTKIELPLDLPKTFGDDLSLFSQGVAFQYYFPINEKLLVNVNFNAFYNSDYRSNSKSAWFFTGYAAGAWKLNPKTNLLFGVYHNGAAKSWKTIPIGGVVWKPRDDFYLEGTIPYPKIAKRVDWGVVDPEINASPYWVYLSGDVGGNIWKFRTDAATDVRGADSVWADRSAEARYFDYRLCVGVESRTGKDVDWAVEGGVAFARELTLETVDGGDYFSRRHKPSPAGFFRVRVEY